ncbi:prolyl-tRNA synthetase associated domain-containing protein [Alphaproteobacteria bacterium]|nr:prolyl-tRNA synthetase associated domain-containing protein [Alphaproteobacteria bacterium]
MKNNVNNILVNKEPNASSQFQDKLPISSDSLMHKLSQWNIEYKYFEHNPLRTVKDSKLVQHMFLKTDQGGGHIKNLYLRDHKKKNVLLVSHQDTLIDLKALQVKIGMGRLSFGSPERLMENLGVFPGAVTPFSMINGVNNNVLLFIDTSLRSYQKIYAHPLVNDRTLELSVESLEMFFEKIKVVPSWINL